MDAVENIVRLAGEFSENNVAAEYNVAASPLCPVAPPAATHARTYKLSEAVLKFSIP